MSSRFGCLALCLLFVIGALLSLLYPSSPRGMGPYLALWSGFATSVSFLVIHSVVLRITSQKK